VVDAGIGSAAIVQATAAAAWAGWRLAFRVLDANNAYWVLCKGAGLGTDVVKWQAGVATVILHVATDISHGSVVKVLLIDDSISLYIGGVFRGSVTGQTFLMGATQHGLSCATGGTDSRWTNFSVSQNYTTKIIGLGFSNSSTSYNDVEFGWYFDAVNKNAQPMEGGTLKSVAVSALVGDSFKVEVRQVVDTIFGATTQHMVVTYWRKATGTGDWVLAYTSTTNPTVSSATPLYVDTALYHVGAMFASVQVRRFTYGVYRDSTSVATYGPMWAKELLQDDTLDSPAKRQNAANALFARYGYPRITLSVKCLKQLHQGRRILVNNTRLGITNQVRIISKVEASQPSSQVREYTVQLGDRPYEYGDDEPLGYLLRLPDRDLSAPTPPSNFAATGATRSGMLMQETFTWDKPAGGNSDATYIEIYVSPAQADVGGITRRFPAQAGNAVWTGLTPGRFYNARALFRDWNNNASPLTDFIQFSVPGIPAPPAPTWAATPYVVVGVMPGTDTGAADLYWIPPAPAYDPAAIVIYATYPNGKRDPVVVPAPTNSYRLNGLVTGVPYTVALATRDSYGVEGLPSVVTQTITIQPVGTPNVYNGEFEISDPTNDAWPDGWTGVPTVGTGSHALSTVAPYSGKQSLRVTMVTTGLGGGYVMTNRKLFAPPNRSYYATAMARTVSGTGAAFVDMRFNAYDSAGSLISHSTLTVPNPNLTTSWLEFVSAPFTPPANTVLLELELSFSTAGTSNLLMDLDTVRLVEQTRSSDLGTGLLDKTHFGTALSAIQKGASNPASPATDDRNFRLFGTTGDRDTFWNGSYWVSTDLKNINITNTATITAVSVTGSNVGRIAHNGDLDWWLGRFAAAVFVATTSGVSDFWTLVLQYVTAGNTVTNVASMTTAAVAANTWARIATNTFSPATMPGSSVFMVQVIANKTGAPGTLLVAPQLCYREIV
jgi:hypothetical protein